MTNNDWYEPYNPAIYYPGGSVPEYVDELQFVDADIRAAFEGKRYMRGVPTMIQHTRTMQRMIEQQESSNDDQNEQPLSPTAGSVSSNTHG